MKIQNKLFSLLLLIIICISNLGFAQVNIDSNNNENLQELIPKHNVQNSDRINLVFNVVNNPDYNIDELVKKNIVDLIGWNGPLLTKDNENKIEIKRGFFATDPVREYKNKFNIWIRYQKTNEIETDELYNNLKNKLIIRIGNYSFGTSTLWRYAKEDNKIPYTNIYNEPDNMTQYSNWGYVLSHELGHSLFSFMDEYESSIIYLNDYKTENSSITTIDQVYQNIKNNKKCVEQLPTKPKYFNQIDPMFEEVINDYKDLGIDKKLDKENFEITYYKKDICSGKYSVADIDNFGAENSTVYSIMEGADDNNYNIWGLLKKQEIIKFLNQYKGVGDNIPYTKRVFTKQDYDKINNTKFEDLYKENLDLVNNALYIRRPNNQSQSLNNIKENILNFIPYMLGIGTVFFLLFLINKIHKNIINKLNK
jgi:hypothetical protein